jgi:hypothetical protein
VPAPNEGVDGVMEGAGEGSANPAPGVPAPNEG